MIDFLAYFSGLGTRWTPSLVSPLGRVLCIGQEVLISLQFEAVVTFGHPQLGSVLLAICVLGKAWKQLHPTQPAK